MRKFLILMLVWPTIPTSAVADSIELFNSGVVVTGAITGSSGNISATTVDLGVIEEFAIPITQADIQNEMDAGGQLIVDAAGTVVLLSGDPDQSMQLIVPGSEGAELLGFRFCELIGTCSISPE